MVIYLRSLFMLVPYGLAEAKYCRLILCLCLGIFIQEVNIFSPIEMLYNNLLV